MVEETILLSKLTDQLKYSKNTKVISLKDVAQLNNQKSASDEYDEGEQYISYQMKIENSKHQLASLEQQKDKMLNDLKKAIDKEKQEWMNQKKVEEQQAKEMGYKIGFDQGREEALSEYAELIEKANKLVDASTEDYHRMIEKHEEAVIQLAIACAEKIIGLEMKENPTVFTSIVKKAIEELKDHSHVTIYVHPDDYPVLMKQKEELEQLLEDGEIISIYIDQQLNPGDCSIKHPFGQIDVGIDSQLEQIKIALEEKVMEKQ